MVSFMCDLCEQIEQRKAQYDSMLHRESGFLLECFEQAGLPRSDFDKKCVTYRLVEKVLLFYKAKGTITLAVVQTVLKQVFKFLRVNEVTFECDRAYCVHWNPRKNFSRWLLYQINLHSQCRQLTERHKGDKVDLIFNLSFESKCQQIASVLNDFNPKLLNRLVLSISDTLLKVREAYQILPDPTQPIDTAVDSYIEAKASEEATKVVQNSDDKSNYTEKISKQKNKLQRQIRQRMGLLASAKPVPIDLRAHGEVYKISDFNDCVYSALHTFCPTVKYSQVENMTYDYLIEDMIGETKRVLVETPSSNGYNLKNREARISDHINHMDKADGDVPDVEVLRKKSIQTLQIVNCTYEFCYNESVRSFSEFMQMILMPPPETIKFLRDDYKYSQNAQKMNSCIARPVDNTPGHMVDVRKKATTATIERFMRVHQNKGTPYPSVFDTVHHPFVSDVKPNMVRKRGALKADILGSKSLDKHNLAQVNETYSMHDKFVLNKY